MFLVLMSFPLLSAFTYRFISLIENEEEIRWNAFFSPNLFKNETLILFNTCILAAMLTSTFFIFERFEKPLDIALYIVVSYSLITLSFIDSKTKLLPDVITLPTIAILVLASIAGVGLDIYSLLRGGVVGYLSLFIVMKIHFKISGKLDAVGYGDFKLLCLVGCFLGWELLLDTLIYSGLLAILWFYISKSEDEVMSRKIPYGPFISFAAWFLLVFGSEWWVYKFYG